MMTSTARSIALSQEEEPTVDERLEELKKQRLKLKDEIAGLLAEAM